MFVETFNETTTRPMIFVIEKFVTTMREKLYIYIYISIFCYFCHIPKFLNQLLKLCERFGVGQYQSFYSQTHSI